MTKKFTLGKNERLKSRKLIEQLFSDGKSFNVLPYRVLYKLTNSAERFNDELQFGVAVSSKNFKKAVHRNRIKRLTREAYRLQKLPLQEKLKEKQSCLFLFFIYTNKELPEYPILKDKVNLILERLIKMINENNSSYS
jgi:ribonuclease P protein component